MEHEVKKIETPYGVVHLAGDSKRGFVPIGQPDLQTDDWQVIENYLSSPSTMAFDESLLEDDEFKGMLGRTIQAQALASSSETSRR